VQTSSARRAGSCAKDPTFVAVRNAFAHWSFGWEIVNQESWILVYDVKSGAEKMRVHQRHGDALHLVAFTIVDVIHEALIRRTST